MDAIGVMVQVLNSCSSTATTCRADPGDYYSCMLAASAEVINGCLPHCPVKWLSTKRDPVPLGYCCQQAVHRLPSGQDWHPGSALLVHQATLLLSSPDPPVKPGTGPALCLLPLPFLAPADHLLLPSPPGLGCIVAETITDAITLAVNRYTSVCRRRAWLMKLKAQGCTELLYGAVMRKLQQDATDTAM